MNTQKVRPEIGDECWFVSWVYELAYAGGDIDRDSCKTRTRRVATREDAERLAREVYPQAADCFGYVEYWHARYEAYDDGDGPYGYHWEATEEYPEAYEGE